MQIKIEHRLAFVTLFLSLFLGAASYYYLFNLAKAQMLNFSISSLAEDASQSRVTAADILSQGVPNQEWQKFLESKDYQTQGFLVQRGIDSRLFAVTKLGSDQFLMKTRNAGFDEWTESAAPKFLLFVTGSALIMGVLVLFLGRTALRPMTDLRRATEDILAGKYEVRSRYKGKDDVGSTLRALGALCKELEKKELLLEKSSELAFTDGMTGLKNHRMFKDFFQRQLLLAQRHDQFLSILMLDVDHFKKFNDTYGHQQGDEVLKAVAKALMAGARGSDFVARYGGEEFVVVLPSTNFAGLQQVAEKLRKGIEDTQIPSLADSKVLRVTASFGGYTIDGSKLEKKTTETIAKYIELADQNLYKAKKQGRNRFVVS